ncbi:MAG: hypothetical protein EA363_05700 [Balneolaceae bacterium]|nr:MAG: hypothetical protein EA363_05700 [Balneolaceae bacterium]
MKKINITLIAALILVYMPQLATGQGSNVDVEIMARDDGKAFIYHDMPVPLSHGFHVYRSVEGGEWEQLTPEPVFPVQNGFQLQQNLGTRFDDLSGFDQQDDPQTIFLRLRSASDRAMIAMYAMPDLAQQMGHLFVDEDAPLNQRVTYRFELMDNLDNEVGTSFTGEAMLRPFSPIAPENLEVSHEGRQVTMSWRYPALGTANTDFVISFRPRFQRVDRQQPRRAGTTLPLRLSRQTDYQQHFRVPETGVEYEFWVEAVDYSGQFSPASNRVRLQIGDNVPPPTVSGVRGRMTRDYQAEITWNVSTAVDIAGYHVYRALSDEEQTERITEELLPPLQTTFIDETTEPGTHYRYQITAVDQNGNESEPSTNATVLVIDYTIPEPVIGLNAGFSEEVGTVQLNWEPGDVYQNLRSYRILRRQVNPPVGNTYSQLNPGQHHELAFTDLGLAGEGFTEGATYEYGVAVVNLSGNISDTLFTRIQIPVITPPEPPGMVTAEMQANRRVGLNWNASVSRDVTHYRIYRTDVETDSLIELHTTRRGNRFYRDEDVALNRTFVYGVAAVDSAGNESLQMLADALVTGRVNPPVPAHNVQARATEEGVMLSWQVRGETEHISGFQIYRAGIATGRYEPVGEADLQQLSFTDSQGTAGMWYRVYPVDENGQRAREARATQAVTR